MSKMPGFWIYAILVFFLYGCAHLPQPVLPPHIKKIDIPIFENRTYRYGLEERLTNSVIEGFILDGRLRVVKSEEADAELRGEIIAYSEEPLSYDDEGYVTEYRLWMRVSVLFYDLRSKKILWRDEIEDDLIYIPEESSLVAEGMIPETEEEAEERLIEKIASYVVKRTIEGWW
jgi:outer membrane lipopolysaccharide assembly protein LptE/RlpB